MWRICLLEGGIVPLVRRCVYHVYRPLYRRWTKCDKNEINSRLLERLDESWNEKLLAWKSDCAERGKWQMDVVWRHLLAVMNGWDWKMHIHQGLGSSFHIYLGRGKSRFGVTFQCIVARKNIFFCGRRWCGPSPRLTAKCLLAPHELEYFHFIVQFSYTQYNKVDQASCKFKDLDILIV